MIIKKWMILYLLAAVIAVAAVSCNLTGSQYKGNLAPVKMDTAFVDLNIKDSNRYFLVSFEFFEKKTNNRKFGNDWFYVSNGFPSYNTIDSLIFTFVPYNRSCYGPLNILSIYEFKNRQDYLDFSEGFIGDTIISNKINCK